MVGGTKIGRLGLANGEYVFVKNEDGGVDDQIGKVVDANLKNVVNDNRDKPHLYYYACVLDLIHLFLTTRQPLETTPFGGPYYVIMRVSLCTYS